MHLMKLNFICLAISLLITISSQAQRKRQLDPNDTSSNYQPSKLFSPLFYSEKGNEFHSANGAPGLKYWQNRVDYRLSATLDTNAKTITATEKIRYTNNSPDALQYLWLQLDQNTYKKDARSNFAQLFHRALSNILTATLLNRLPLITGMWYKKLNLLLPTRACKYA